MLVRKLILRAFIPLAIGALAVAVLPTTRVATPPLDVKAVSSPAVDGTVSVTFGPPSTYLQGAPTACAPGGSGHLGVSVNTAATSIPTAATNRVRVVFSGGPTFDLAPGGAWEHVIPTTDTFTCPVGSVLSYTLAAFQPNPLGGPDIQSGVSAGTYPLTTVD